MLVSSLSLRDLQRLADQLESFSGNNARIWARTGGCNGNVANCKIGACTGNQLDWSVGRRHTAESESEADVIRSPGDNGKYSATGATVSAPRTRIGSGGPRRADHPTLLQLAEFTFTGTESYDGELRRPFVTPRDGTDR